jgi:hypothetical protein
MDTASYLRYKVCAVEKYPEITRTNPFDVIARGVSSEILKVTRSRRKNYRALMKRGDDLLDALENANLTVDRELETELLVDVTRYGISQIRGFDIRSYVRNPTSGVTVNDALDVVFAAQDEILYRYVPPGRE